MCLRGCVEQVVIGLGNWGAHVVVMESTDSGSTATHGAARNPGYARSTDITRRCKGHARSYRIKGGSEGLLHALLDA